MKPTLCCAIYASLPNIPGARFEDDDSRRIVSLSRADRRDCDFMIFGPARRLSADAAFRYSARRRSAFIRRGFLAPSPLQNTQLTLTAAYYQIRALGIFSVRLGQYICAPFSGFANATTGIIALLCCDIEMLKAISPFRRVCYR